MASIRDVWTSANNVIRSARQIINEQLRPLGLSSAEGNILLHMLMSPENRYQEQLVTQLDISKGAVSRAVDSLVDKGYLHREKASHDKRFTQLHLSDKAQALSTEIEKIYTGLYMRAIENISENEFKTLISILNRVSKNLTSD